MGGLNAGMSLTVEHLLESINGAFNGTCPWQPVGRPRFEYIQYDLGYLSQFSMPAELAQQCATLSGHIDSLFPFLDAIVVPTLDVYGAGKASGEPFGAAGDYNGDGLTNKQTYDYVTGGGGDRVEFVRAAASLDPFWSGNPGLPVAGPFALLILTGLSTAAGLYSLVKLVRMERKSN